MPSNHVQLNHSNDPSLNWEVPDSKMSLVTRLLNYLDGDKCVIRQREPLRGITKEFQVTREDDCIWLHDIRGDGGASCAPVHCVPSQAEDLIELLLSVL